MLSIGLEGRGSSIGYKNEQTLVWLDVIVSLCCCVYISDVPFPLVDLVYKARADIHAGCHPHSFALIAVSTADQLTVSRTAALTVPAT